MIVSFTANPAFLPAGDKTTLAVDATDAEADSLTYTYLEYLTVYFNEIGDASWPRIADGQGDDNLATAPPRRL